MIAQNSAFLSGTTGGKIRMLNELSGSTVSEKPYCGCSLQRFFYKILPVKGFRLFSWMGGFCAGLPDQFSSVGGSQMVQTLVSQVLEKIRFKFPFGLERQTVLLNLPENVTYQPFSYHFIFYQRLTKPQGNGLVVDGPQDHLIFLGYSIRQLFIRRQHD
ncbi:hypothetical protein [Larkinella insperata]|uniref:hypothetical protein n=1 Tax=Larkinella insperata TaxID=332158 RepID=UPI002248DB02|nr:hypothetical protein [Larkinella insperata]